MRIEKTHPKILSCFLLYLLLMLFSIPYGLPAEELQTDTKVKPTTRKLSLSESINNENLLSSPLFKAFHNISKENIKAVYHSSRNEAKRILVEKELNPTYFRVLYYQSGNLLLKARESSQNSMLVFLPIFSIIFLIIIVPYGFKVFLFPLNLKKVKPPENANPVEEVDTDEDEADEENELANADEDAGEYEEESDDNSALEIGEDDVK